MEKHYVVVLDWAHDEDYGVELIAVCHTMEDALDKFAERIGDEKEFAREHGFEIEEDTATVFEAGIMGEWRIYHTLLYIEIV